MIYRRQLVAIFVCRNGDNQSSGLCAFRRLPCIVTHITGSAYSLNSRRRICRIRRKSKNIFTVIFFAHVGRQRKENTLGSLSGIIGRCTVFEHNSRCIRDAIYIIAIIFNVRLCIFSIKITIRKIISNAFLWQCIGGISLETVHR